MRQASRLILNASATFMRMAVNIGIGLLTTRILLQQLGKVDFGLVMAISAAVSIFTILSVTLRTSIGRQMGLATGQNLVDKKANIFASAHLVFALCALLICGLSFIVSEPILAQLTIPAERLSATTVLFYFTALNLALMVLFTPHEVVLVSEQEIVVTSVFQVLDAVFKAVAACILIVATHDKMITYIVILTGLNFLMLSARAAVCMRKLPYSRVSPLQYSKAEVQEMFAFSRWTAMHTAANYLRQDAMVLLINIGFGAVWNAMYAVGQQISTYLRNFSMALEAVVLPASLKSEGGDDRHQAVRIAFKGEKYTLLLISLVALPLFLEAPQIIRLWLGANSYEPPMAIFAQLLIVWSLLNITTRCHSLVLFAQGDYGVYSFVQMLIAIVVLIVACVLTFKFQLQAIHIPWIMIAGSLLLNVYRVLHVRTRLNISVAYWFEHVFFPFLWCLLPAAALAYFLYSSLPVSVWRPLAITATYAMTVIPFIWFKGMTSEERDHILSILKPIFFKQS